MWFPISCPVCLKKIIWYNMVITCVVTELSSRLADLDARAQELWGLRLCRLYMGHQENSVEEIPGFL